MRKFLFCLLFFFLAQISVFAQAIVLSDKASVSVLTCASGNEVYSLFGHTAIRIKDIERNLDVVYNYGAFDFEAPNFILRFTKGDLQYFVTADPFEDFTYQYFYDKRAVYEQVLNLTQDQKQRLFDRLNSVLFSDDRFYTYKFIDRNCTNMTVDIINDLLGEKVIVKTGDKSMPYRDVLYPYFNGHFYEQLGTSVIFGTKVDEKATLLFLPVELQQSLETVKYDARPLSGKSTTLLNFPPVPQGGSWWNNIYTYLLALLLIVILNRKVITLTYLVFIALIGTFFSISGFYSFHEELANNYNALLFNPLLFGVVYFYLSGNRNWLYRFSILCAAFIGIYILVILNKVYFLIVLPLVVTNLIILGRFIFRYRIENKKN